MGHWESSPKREFIALLAYLIKEKEKKQEKAQINNPNLHLKELENNNK